MIGEKSSINFNRQFMVAFISLQKFDLQAERKTTPFQAHTCTKNIESALTGKKKRQKSSNNNNKIAVKCLLA